MKGGHQCHTLKKKKTFSKLETHTYFKSYYKAIGIKTVCSAMKADRSVAYNWETLTFIGNPFLFIKKRGLSGTCLRGAKVRGHIWQWLLDDLRNTEGHWQETWVHVCLRTVHFSQKHHDTSCVPPLQGREQPFQQMVLGYLISTCRTMKLDEVKVLYYTT